MKYEEISVKNKLIKNVQALYESAFPRDERRDFIEVIRLMETKHELFHVRVFENEAGFAGFLTSWEWDDFRYFEHFAIDSTLRNKGIGAIALQQAIGTCNKPAILEVEPPETELARRRIGFYERNGFRLWTTLPYLQPSYGKGKNPVRLCLMTAGNITFAGENDEKILRIKREVYGCPGMEQ